MKDSVEVVVNKPIAEVFQFVSDPRSLLQWDSGVREMKKVEQGPIKAGSHFRGDYQGMGQTLLEVTGYDPNQRVTTLAESKLMTYKLTDEVEATEGGTRLRRTIDGHFNGLLRFILEPLMGGPFRKNFIKSATQVKEAIESGKTA